MARGRKQEQEQERERTVIRREESRSGEEKHSQQGTAVVPPVSFDKSSSLIRVISTANAEPRSSLEKFRVKPKEAKSPAVKPERDIETIKQPEAKVNEQAEIIKRPEAEVEEQAETIEPLETAVKKQLGEMATFTFPSPVQAKFDRLMDKNNEGMLTPAEREEYSALVKLNELVAILKGQAQWLLRSMPATR